MSFILQDACLYVETVSTAQKAVLVVLASFADEHGKGAFPSVKRIALMASLSPRSVTRALNDLKEMGFIEPTSSRAGGGRNTVHYDLIAGALYENAAYVKKHKRWNLDLKKKP